MRNLILLVVVLTINTELFAQTIGISAGLNLSTIKMHNDYETYSISPKSGFKVGVTYEMILSKFSSVESGLFLSNKGTIINQQPDKIINLNYLVIPYCWKLSLDNGSVKVYCLGGPYLSFGLNGKSGDVKVNWKSDLKRFDFGLTAGIGIEIRSIQLGLSYDLGLSNLAPNEYYMNSLDIKNRVFGISLGYRFIENLKNSYL